MKSNNRDPAGWPVKLAEEAYYGLAGDLVRKIEPHTEADPVALLIQFLVVFGNVIGRNSYFVVEATRHHLNLFTVLVGETAKARKGTALDHIIRLIDTDLPDWSQQHKKSGLSSGEGLIEAVSKIREVLVIETEFTSPLKMMARKGNTLSPVIRDAWDRGNLSIMTKQSPLQVNGAHISIIGHITSTELLGSLQATEMANGFANRFLWALVRRSKLLPEGGKIDTVDFSDEIQRLRKAIEFAQNAGEIKRDEKARNLWHEVYPSLSEGDRGMVGAIMARAEPQVMRLACLYAQLDCSEVVRVEHLKAALAVWRYCEDSVRFIFGGQAGSRPGNSILCHLQRASEEGLSRTEISDLFQRNISKQKIDEALIQLQETGLVCMRKERKEGSDRPVERWFAVEVETGFNGSMSDEKKEFRNSSDDIPHTENHLPDDTLSTNED